MSSSCPEPQTKILLSQCLAHLTASVGGLVAPLLLELRAKISVVQGYGWPARMLRTRVPDRKGLWPRLPNTGRVCQHPCCPRVRRCLRQSATPGHKVSDWVLCSLRFKDIKPATSLECSSAHHAGADVPGARSRSCGGRTRVKDGLCFDRPLNVRGAGGVVR